MAKKDFNMPKHGEIDTKNLFVRVSSLATISGFLMTQIRSLESIGDSIKCGINTSY